MIVKSREAIPTAYPQSARIGGDSNHTGLVMAELLASVGHLSVPYAYVDANESRIEYESGNRFNYCLHEYDSLEVNDKLCRIPYTRGWIDTDQTPYWYHTSCWKGISLPQFPPPTDNISVTGEMRRRAWNSVYPEINDGLQLAVSIFEFRDFPRLIGTAKRLKQAMTSLLKSGRKPALGELLNDAFLSYNFGVLPILSDIEGLSSDLLQLRKKVAEFREKGRKPQPYHYTEVVSDHSSYVPHSNGEITYTRKNVYNATIKMSYEYGTPTKWKAIQRVGGLRITPYTVWQAIPWSFVIDWVLDVSDFLDQFDNDPLVTVTIHDYCDSIKCISQYDYHRTLGSAGFAIPFPGSGDIGPELYGVIHRGLSMAPLWTWKRVYYQRSPGLPDTGYALPVWDSLSLRQLVLGAALLKART